MRWSGKRGSQPARPIDTELNARLSRLRSELAQTRATAEGDAVGSALDHAERRLEEAEALAENAADANAEDSAEVKDKCLLAVQDVEAEFCMLKPAELLYPTWIRLRESLYRFDSGRHTDRRKAWVSDIGDRVSANVTEWEPVRLQILRQRLRQLTLELRESALRYNRLNEERARVTRDVIDLGVRLLCLFGVSVMACLTLSACVASPRSLTLVSLVASVSAGGMGAVFSRLGTPRDEKVREKFSGIFRSDMRLHVGVGSGAALLVAAIVLSGRIFALPETSMAQVALLVVLGFGAGFSDRLWHVMLSRVIGTSSRHSSRDGE